MRLVTTKVFAVGRSNEVRWVDRLKISGGLRMNVKAQANSISILFLIGICGGHAASAQNVTVHGTLTDLQSAYFATQGGNVGVGTQSPQASLHVFGNSPGSVIARVENASPTGEARVVVAGNSNTLTSSFLQIITNGAAGGLAGGSILFYDSYSSARAAIKVRTSSSAGDKGAMTFVAGGQGGESMDGQLTILPNGNVGVGVPVPAYRLHVNGTAAALSWQTPSSRVFKQDVRHLANKDYAHVLSELAQVDLARYRYRPEVTSDDGEHFGFIAEELPREVLSRDGKAVDVYALASYGLAASKALMTRNDVLTNEVRELRRELDAQRREIAKLSAGAMR